MTMDNNEGGELRMENLVGISPLPEQITSSLGGAFGFPTEDNKCSSLGFLDLLGMQDFSTSMFELHLPPPPPPPPLPPAVSPFPQESSDTGVFPATPNSSSISSSSTEAPNDADQPKSMAAKEEVEQVEEKKDGTPSKGKKKGQKRQREARFAFMTRSEVDHLEDGYRWRKYGQKAVKNSPYPRSYFRCTSAMCGVKKRVERSSEDSTVVVTTYEGQHTHPSPVLPRGSHPAGGPPDASPFLLPLQVKGLPQQQPFNLSYFNGLAPPSGFSSVGSVGSVIHAAATRNIGNTISGGGFIQERKYSNQTANFAIRDYGLLQDVIPSDMMRKE